MKNNDLNSLLSRRDFFKKAAKRILPILATIVIISFLPSCGDGNEELETALNSGGGSSYEDLTNDPRCQEEYSQLKCTAWQLHTAEEYITEKESTSRYNMFDRYRTDEVLSYIYSTIFFTDKRIRGAYELRHSTFDKEGLWWIKFNEEGKKQLYMYNAWYFYGDKSGISSTQSGALGNFLPAVSDIESLDDETLKLSRTYIDGDYKSYKIWTFKRKSYTDVPNDDPSSGNQGGNQGSGYEKPEIGFYDFTATKTSVTVTYQIFNKSQCGSLSSAKIYYGTSSASKSVSASITGNYIKATISGLKAGTSYYVKCSVTGSGGTTTSEQTKVITNF